MFRSCVHSFLTDHCLFFKIFWPAQLSYVGACIYVKIVKNRNSEVSKKSTKNCLAHEKWMENVLLITFNALNIKTLPWGYIHVIPAAQEHGIYQTISVHIMKIQIYTMYVGGENHVYAAPGQSFDV